MNEPNTYKKKVIEALIQYKGIVTDACKAAGIGRTSFYEWLKEDPEFAAAVEDAKEQAIDFVEGRLFNLIENDDTTATIFFLKTRGKNRGYVERNEVTGKDGADLIPKITIEIIGRSEDKSE